MSTLSRTDTSAVLAQPSVAPRARHTFPARSSGPTSGPLFALPKRADPSQVVQMLVNTKQGFNSTMNGSLSALMIPLPSNRVDHLRRPGCY